MGFWDSKLADLEAIGIRFDPLMERALEGEGDVMHLHHMLSPFSNPEYQEGCYDQEGRPVWVVEKIHTLRPEGLLVADAEYARKGSSVGKRLRTTADDVSDTWGKDWVDYPSITGLLENEDRYNAYIYYGWNAMRAETATPYRFWLCYPFDEQVYNDLAAACDQRLQEAFFYDIDEVNSFEYGDDYWVDTPTVWLWLHDPESLKEKERAYVQAWYDERKSDDAWRDQLDRVLASWKVLVEAGIYPPADPKEQANWEFTGLPFKPMEHYLADKPAAWAIWRTLMAQREYVLSRVSTTSGVARDYIERFEEYL